jgi:transcriptional regulator with XRE-family HTH domain
LATNRRRLGLSAAKLGLLVGASGQSIYQWETGKAQPRSKSLAAIVELRGIGKEEAASELRSSRAQAEFQPFECVDIRESFVLAFAAPSTVRYRMIVRASDGRGPY